MFSSSWKVLSLLVFLHLTVRLTDLCVRVPLRKTQDTGPRPDRREDPPLSLSKGPPFLRWEPMTQTHKVFEAQHTR